MVTVPLILQNFLLLFVSYAFIVWVDVRALIILLLSTCATYLFALCIGKSPKFVLTIALLLHLTLLATFKFQGWLIPIGLSFYTFQAMGYLIDVSRKEIQPCRNVIDFALFLAFFPKIVAGPIERAAHFLPQVHNRRIITFSKIQEGIYLIIWGLTQKLVIAAGAARIADAGFSAQPTVHIAVATLAFTLQIYADFSGYSDLAKGVASLLGFDLTWNFRMPYFSGSPQEFWRRWHVSLSEWFRDYVYIPLGGSRNGALHTAINLLLTMGLVGLWHGAQWTYVWWGIYQGVLLVLYRFGARLNLKSVRIVAIPFFFLLTVFGWMLFRSATPDEFIRVLRGGILPVGYTVTMMDLAALWLPVIAIDAYRARRKDLLAIAHAPAYVQCTFVIAAISVLALLLPATIPPYLYQKF